MYKIAIFFLCLTWWTNSFSQNITQNINGTVLDNASNRPIPLANIVVINSDKKATTDSLGNFTISNMPIGRYDIKVTMDGYEPFIAKEIEVISAKETNLNIVLKEKHKALAEVIVKIKVNKESAINTTATVSAKMLSVEEAKRYAGGFDDPARLVSAFAGVSSSVNNNGIVVRGNSPKSLQWKFEGVEISNPNHFADLAAFGGGGLSALSSQCLANSDFFSGAFPAEYNNALSGVFDIAMRTGNRNKRENTIQIGLTGIDVASEGPFNKKSHSSYLFNYRYSTLTLLEPILPENGGGVKYQDLSFKLNFPTKKLGTISLWGIGLIDGSGAQANTDSTQWATITDKQTQDVKQYMGAVGISHKYFLNKKSYIKSTLATSTNGIDFKSDKLNASLLLMPESKIKNNTQNIVLSSFINTKYNVFHTNKTGLNVTNMRYNLLLQTENQSALQTIVNDNGNSFLLSAYSNSTLNISQKLVVNVGVNTQLFTLNNNYTVEPRIGAKYQTNPTQAFSFAYGLHSRLEPINYYFTHHPINGNNAINKNLDFSKAHHFVLGYDKNLSDKLHLRVETYYQNLFNVPVIKDSSFSFINMQNDWFFNSKLENTGKGKNYGIDISLDKYMTKGFYYMLTASVFNSTYKGGDAIWRNTRFNRNFAFNFLTGKEWQLGKQKQKIVGANIRMSYQGGDRYSPINTNMSIANQQVVFDEKNSFTQQISPSFTTHFTILYRKNKIKTTTEWAFKVLNATMFKEFYGFQYNYKTQTVSEHRETIFIPNLSYKIQF
jgi:hypothetical protein